MGHLGVSPGFSPSLFPSVAFTSVVLSLRSSYLLDNCPDCFFWLVSFSEPTLLAPSPTHPISLLIFPSPILLPDTILLGSYEPAS